MQQLQSIVDRIGGGQSGVSVPDFSFSPQISQQNVPQTRFQPIDVSPKRSPEWKKTWTFVGIGIAVLAAVVAVIVFVLRNRNQRSAVQFRPDTSTQRLRYSPGDPPSRIAAFRRDAMDPEELRLARAGITRPVVERAFREFLHENL